MNKIFLKKTSRDAHLFGHPWVYKSQIKEAHGSPAPGDLVQVCLESKRILGTGYFNPHSEITIRLLTNREEPINKDFFIKKIQKAVSYREKYVKNTNACRLISSEADGLPGLIVDRYGETAVVQFMTMGMDRLKPMILEAIRACGNFRGIYEKSDMASRRIEGLELKAGWIEKSCGEDVEIFEGDTRYKIYFEKGHKTGFYLDQRENRLYLNDLGIKGNVLDAFCYTGGFGLQLARSGAKVLGIDSQEEIIAQAKENRKLNGLTDGQIDFKAGNVFDELKNLEREERKFDLVILDPPSFVKNKRALEGALAGYKEIELRSMKLLNEDGYLAVFSCSYHVDENLLMQTILSAAHDVRKNLRVIKFLKQSADHPINPFIPETYYLKGYLLQVSSQ